MNALLSKVNDSKLTLIASRKFIFIDGLNKKLYLFMVERLLLSINFSIKRLLPYMIGGLWIRELISICSL
ncbi:hypothetical protein Misp06_02506 [Microbulbifer sp. NBRC 101763]